MKCSRRIALGVVLLTALVARSAAAQEWTRFRGPNGSGVGEAADFPTTWSPKHLLWQAKLPGAGSSSPVLWGDRIFVHSGDPESGDRKLLAFDTTGKQLWEQDFPAATHHLHTQNSYASSTPAVDADYVVAAWATPENLTLVALTHDGVEAWRRELGPFVSQHGFGTSPVILDDLVVLPNDQDGRSFVIAVDRRSGKTVWQTEHESLSPQNASYAVPCLYEPDGGNRQLIVNCWAHGFTSLDPATGATNWQLPVFDRRPVGSPLIVGDLILGNCGDGGGNNSIFAIRPPKGADEAKVVYRVEKSLSPYVPTLIAKDDLLFAWTDRGIVSCLEAKTGATIWKERVGGNFMGSPVRIDDRLFCLSNEGDVVVLRAARKFELLARNSLGDTGRSTPAIAGGRMYVRTESKLFCIGAK